MTEIAQQIYSTAEAAEYLGLSEISVKKYIHESKRLVPDKLVGHSYVFTQATLDAFKKKRGDHLLSSRAAAHELGVSMTTFRKYTNEGLLEAIQVRNAYRFDPEDVALLKKTLGL